MERLALRTGTATTVPDLLAVINTLINDINASFFEQTIGPDQSITIGDGGTIVIASGGIILTDGEEYDGEGSYQPIGPDLAVAITGGSSDGADPSFLAPIMGNILGDSLTADANYLAGVIGAYSITGARATTYPAGAVLGIAMDGVTAIDGCFVAVIDGDSAVTGARAAFAVMSNNSTPGSGFEYGVDLLGAAHDGYSAIAITKALVRSPNNVVVMEGAGVPVDGTTGDNFAGPGSLYIDYTNANVYVQASLITTPAWKLVTRAA